MSIMNDEIAAEADQPRHTLLEERYRSFSPGADGPWNDILETMLSHRSVRSFLPKDIPDATLERAIAAAQSAATSSNLQAWSVIAVRDQAKKASLASLAGSQAYVAECPLFLVWLVDLSRLQRIGDGIGRDLEGLQYIDTFVSALIDVSLAAQNAVTAFESLQLGTVYIGGIRNRPNDVSEELELPSNCMAVFGMCVGYPDSENGTGIKPRLPQSLVLHREIYDASIPATVLRQYDEDSKTFQKEQRMVASGWTEQAMERMVGPRSMSGRDRLRQEMYDMGFSLR